MAMTNEERKALSQLRKRAREFGATVDVTVCFGARELRVTAPNGYRWEAGLHEFVDTVYQPWQPDYQDALERMGSGPEVCDDEHCEWCERS